MTHLRQIMVEELERRNYAPGTIRCYIRTVERYARHFHRSPDQLGPEHIRRYQALMFRKWKLAPNTVAQRLAALRFFYIQVLSELECGRDALSEEGPAPAASAQPAGSRTSDRRSVNTLPSHPADDPICHRWPSCRGGAPNPQRRRQPTHGHSHSRRQGA